MRHEREPHHRQPRDFPILRVENVTDLLAVAIAPELEKWMTEHPLEPGIGYKQALVAFVLDSMTLGAVEQLLSDRRAERAEPRPASPSRAWTDRTLPATPCPAVPDLTGTDLATTSPACRTAPKLDRPSNASPALPRLAAVAPCLARQRLDPPRLPCLDLTDRTLRSLPCPPNRDRPRPTPPCSRRAMPRLPRLDRPTQAVPDPALPAEPHLA
jgi:hypothetical protein